MINLNRRATLLILCFIVSNCTVVLSNHFKRVTESLLEELSWNWEDPILFWNKVSVEACGCDYDPELVKNPDQEGPTYTSRALAIIHGVMYDAYNYVYQPPRILCYLPNITNINVNSQETTVLAAITQGAYHCLCALFPKQKVVYDELRNAYMSILESLTVSGDEIKVGTSIGDLIAAAVLKDRATDGHNLTVSYQSKPDLGYHAADPTRPKQKAHAPHWGNVRPFVVESGSQFRSRDYLGTTVEARQRFLNSKKFLRNYIEILLIGSRESKWRTEDQTEISIFWAYDGSPKLGTPPRFYNQVARVIATQMGNTMAQNAQLFALINYALADVCICSWDTKYHYDFWRPILAIRRGTSILPPIPDWLPLGAPTNGAGDNLTPGFPSFNSGHSAFGSALFQVLRRFYRRDRIRFSLKSDEYNGKTVDSITKKARPERIRHYESFTEAEIENELARIYLGIHWRFDQSDGRIMGRNVGNFICDELL